MNPAKLFKLSTNENALRTPYMEGHSEGGPVVGVPFGMICAPIVEGANGRLILTSVVKAVRPNADGSVEFDTMNSTYLYQPITETTGRVQ